MEVTSQTDPDLVSPWRSAICVVVRRQTYRNLAYLVLTCPLGLCYLAFFSIGFSLGLGLTIILIGIPLLIAMVTAIGPLARVERRLTTRLLRINIATLPRTNSPDAAETGVKARSMRVLTTSETWRSLLYLLVIAGTGWIWCTIVIGLLTPGVMLLLTPLYYTISPVHIFSPTISLGADVWIAETAGAIYGSFIALSVETGIVAVDTLGEAVLVSLLGAGWVIVSLNVINGIAQGLGAVARVLLRTEVDT